MMGKPSIITISMLYDLLLDVKAEIDAIKNRDFNNNFRIYSMNEVSKLERKSSDTIKEEIAAGKRSFHKHKKRKVRRADGTVDVQDVYTFLGKHLEALNQTEPVVEDTIRMESTDDIVKNIIRRHSEKD